LKKVLAFSTRYPLDCHRTGENNLHGSTWGLKMMKKFISALAILLSLTITQSTFAALDSWTGNNGTFAFQDTTQWTLGAVPGASDDAFITNDITGTTTVTNYGTAVTVNSFTMSNNTLFTHRLIISNMTFTVSGTTLLGSNAIFQIGIGSSTVAGGAPATLTTADLTMNDNARIEFIKSSGSIANTLVVSGVFSNSSRSFLGSTASGNGGSYFLRFTDVTKVVTNRGTMSIILNGGGATLSLQVGSGGNFGTFVNEGTFNFINPGGGRTGFVDAVFQNVGTLLMSNNNATAVSPFVLRVTSNVVNRGTIDLVAVGSSAGNKNIISNGAGAFINLGTLRSFTTTIAAEVRSNIIFVAEAGQSFSNAVGGQVVLPAGNEGVLHIRSDAPVNLGTNLVNGGTLLYQTSVGGAVGLRNVGLIQLGAAGNLNASIVTNFGIVRGVGTITGNLVDMSGGKIEPGLSIGTLRITGNVTVKDGGTLSIELGSGVGNNDLLALTGTLTLEPSSALELSGGDIGLVYTVATFSARSGTFGVVTPNYDVNYFSDRIEVMFIPEPSTMVLVGAGMLGLFLFRRRRV
jgi:hypothetical protein